MQHYLVVANRTLGGPALLAAIQERMARGPAHFWVLVPAAVTTHLINDFNALSCAFPVDPDVLPGRDATGDRAVEKATADLARGLERFRAVGAAADGAVGDADPLTAVGQALADQPFDEIILSTLPLGLSRWLSGDLPRRLRRRTDIPLTVITADR